MGKRGILGDFTQREDDKSECRACPLVETEECVFHFLPVWNAVASVNMSLCNAVSWRLQGWGCGGFDGCSENVLPLCLSLAYFTASAHPQINWWQHILLFLAAKSKRRNNKNDKLVRIFTFILRFHPCVMNLMKFKHTWSITFGQQKCSYSLYLIEFEV